MALKPMSLCATKSTGTDTDWTVLHVMSITVNFTGTPWKAVEGFQSWELGNTDLACGSRR